MRYQTLTKKNTFLKSIVVALSLYSAALTLVVVFFLGTLL